MSAVEGKNILLGVTGGIAAFKAASLTSRLVKMGASIRVVMTENATKFVAPLTFQTLSRNPVYVDMFSPGHWQPGHISLAESADLLVIVPATANVIGKLAHGIADDLLTTVALAVKCPIVLAPAMNSNMFDNSIVQDNLGYLKDKGFFIVAPEYGPLACGYEGKGRLADLDVIVEAIRMELTPKDLEGVRVLVTAGPTREWIDPIRFISNRSSGKMGYALARAARDRGARVALISGPTHLKPPPYLEFISIETAAQMRDAVVSRFEWADVLVMSAAVADYRPKERMDHKLKKSKSELTLALTPTTDILAELGKRKEDKILVGFAAETDHLVSNALEKLQAKNLDLIVANNVLERGAGFESDTNIVTLIDKSGKAEKLPILPKDDVAHKVLDKISEMIRREG
jgi:phosphopantothenoylcysteine decarboxylase/phosphopantothenate--cysteine ligase